MSARSGFPPSDTVVAYDAGGWVAAPRAWWMFLSFGHRRREGAGRGPAEVEGRRPPGRVRRGQRQNPQNSRRSSIPAFVRSKAAIARQYRDEEGAGGRRAPAPAFRGHGRRAVAGPPLRPYSGSRNVPYAELFDARTGAMKPLEELRKAFSDGRRRSRKADRHQLRLRRLGAGADARSLSPRRARQRAL